MAFFFLIEELLPIVAKPQHERTFRLVQFKEKTGGALLYSLCCVLFSTVTLHLFTLSLDNINLLQSEIQQHKKKYGHKENPLLWHIHIVSYKTALVTLTNAKSVLLKGQGSRYNNEPSGPGSSSPAETQTLHHLQPGVYKGEESGREGRERQII